jgi:hypothetical protein
VKVALFQPGSHRECRGPISWLWKACQGSWRWRGRCSRPRRWLNHHPRGRGVDRVKRVRSRSGGSKVVIASAGCDIAILVDRKSFQPTQACTSVGNTRGFTGSKNSKQRIASRPSDDLGKYFNSGKGGVVAVGVRDHKCVGGERGQGATWLLNSILRTSSPVLMSSSSYRTGSDNWCFAILNTSQMFGKIPNLSLRPLDNQV